MKALSIIGASLVLWAGIVSAQNITVTTTVNGTSGPWNWVNGGLNTAYQYGYGFTAPAVISASNGFSFLGGAQLTVSYNSGSVDSVAGDSYWDANGNTNPPALNNGDWYWVGPSYYMDPATYPINRGELVGTFANSNGQIVGTPFAIGDLAILAVPTGATQLQLGVNDTEYDDNLGSWNIQITQVPEPTTTALVLVGGVGLGLAVRGFQRRAGEHVV